MSIDPRHILSLSGGKDSAALAVYMRDRVPQMEYIFHDTEKELPETYEYLGRLEAILGKKITKTTADMGFDQWLDIYGGMIPSNHRRDGIFGGCGGVDPRLDQFCPAQLRHG